jgi:tRNA threonylcarbamoyladenosine biosynthesis protein TsaE
METIISTSEKRTLELAEKLAQKSKTPLCLCLYGDLGSGKTVFSKGFARGLGIEPKKIKSPTFTLVRKYEVGKKLFYHCDFYRIMEPDELLSADLEEIFQQKNAVVVIEWPERIEKLLPGKRMDIAFEYKDPTTRIITMNP